MVRFRPWAPSPPLRCWSTTENSDINGVHRSSGTHERYTWHWQWRVLGSIRRPEFTGSGGAGPTTSDPAAGPLKTQDSERAGPLHPALRVSLDYVREIGSGPLFPELPPDKFRQPRGNGTKVLGRWVRSLGITDERISTNHSWRHRLKTLALRHGLATDIVNAEPAAPMFSEQ